jgi:uncharacterized protein YdcH (DUF465 family)
MKTNTNHFESLNKRLDKIDKDIKDIKDGVKRNDTHISFVTRLYFSMKKPMLRLVNYLGYQVDKNVSDEDVNTGENLFIESQLKMLIDDKTFILPALTVEEERMLNIV